MNTFGERCSITTSIEWKKNGKIDFPDILILHTGIDAARQYDEKFDGFYTFDVAARVLPGAMAPY